LADHATPLKAALSEYVQAVAAGRYPAAEHEYVMPPAERKSFQESLGTDKAVAPEGV